jgi:phosphoserine phosphatase
MRRTVFVFDLDGTLVDSVYQHVLAWQEALELHGIELSVWRIHRRMGMSGGLFVGALLRETGQPVDAELVARLQQAHAEAYQARAGQARVLPGARELLARLTEAGVPWAVATSGLMTAARPTLETLGVPADVPVVTRDQVERAALEGRHLGMGQDQEPVLGQPGHHRLGDLGRLQQRPGGQHRGVGPHPLGHRRAHPLRAQARHPPTPASPQRMASHSARATVPCLVTL